MAEYLRTALTESADKQIKADKVTYPPAPVPQPQTHRPSILKLLY